VPENLPEVEALTSLRVSLFKRPTAVNPLIVFVVPSNLDVSERPVTVAVALNISPVI
jgi:hypothetical protein